MYPCENFFNDWGKETCEFLRIALWNYKVILSSLRGHKLKVYIF